MKSLENVVANKTQIHGEFTLLMKSTYIVHICNEPNASTTPLDSFIVHTIILNALNEYSNDVFTIYIPSKTILYIYIPSQLWNMRG